MKRRSFFASVACAIGATLGLDTSQWFQPKTETTVFAEFLNPYLTDNTAWFIIGEPHNVVFRWKDGDWDRKPARWYPHSTQGETYVMPCPLGEDCPVCTA